MSFGLLVLYLVIAFLAGLGAGTGAARKREHKLTVALRSSVIQLARYRDKNHVDDEQLGNILADLRMALTA